MPRRPTHETIACQYFVWRMFRGRGVFYADGRSAKHNLGKHSLATRDPQQALSNLRRLDQKKAVDLGLAETSHNSTVNAPLTLGRGWELYIAYCSRSRVMGGVGPGTKKRYAAVRDKHLKFCMSQGLETWEQVNKDHVEHYGNWLTGRDYADRSVYLELTLLKSIVKWLVGNKHCPRRIGLACD